MLPKIQELEKLFKNKIDQFDKKLGQLQQSQSISQMKKSLENNRLDILIQSFDKNNQRLVDIQQNLQKNKRSKTTQNIQQVITSPFLSDVRGFPSIPREDSVLLSQSAKPVGNAEVLEHMRLNNNLFVEAIRML